MKSTPDRRLRLLPGGWRQRAITASWYGAFAAGSTDEDMNLALWRWTDTLPARLVLIDDEDRLS